MKFITKKINPLGDNDPKYGQRYWGYVEESEMPVSFNLMNPVDIREGVTLEFDEKAIKESKKGTEYLFLRKVKVSGEALVQPTSDDKKLLELIYDDTQKILKLLDGRSGYEKAKDTAEEIKAKTAEEEQVVEDIGDEPISLEDIPF